ncbi:MAG: SRPBCC family protein [Burkholderiales bacterium]
MFKTIAIGVLVLIAALLSYAATRPDTFRVERAASIKAPPEKIFALVNDLRRWGSWSPWEKKDPAMRRTFGDATSGKGASYAWEGNKDVGQGRMEIAESVPPSRVRIKLDFVKPFEAHNLVDFTLEPKGESTQVTWAIHGPSPYVSRLIGIFVSMDSMIGRDFEAGLADLKAVAER